MKWSIFLICGIVQAETSQLIENIITFDKVIVDNQTFRTTFKYEDGVLKLIEALPYQGIDDQIEETTRRATTYNITGFTSCVEYSKAACTAELPNFTLPQSVYDAGHCATSIRCRTGGDKAKDSTSPINLWSYELVFDELACVDHNPAKLRGNILAVPIYKYWTCPSLNTTKQVLGMPGLFLIKSYGNKGKGEVRITHKKGKFYGKSMWYAYDFTLEYKAPNCENYGNASYLYYGHKDGILWINADNNCGGGLLVMTENAKFPTYEAMFFVDVP